MNRSAKSPATSKKKVTLRSEIVGGAFLIPLTLLVAMGAITYFLARSTWIDQSMRSLETVATIQEDRIDAYIASGDSSLSLILSRSSMKTAIAYYQATDDPHFRAEAVRALFDGVMATPDFTSVTIFDRDLEPLLYAGSVETQPLIPSAVVEAAVDGVTHGKVVATDGDDPVNLVGMPVIIDDVVVGVAVAGQSVGELFALTTDTTGLGKTGETILVQEVHGDIVPISPLRFDGAAPDTQPTEIVEAGLVEDALAGDEASTTEAIDYQGEQVYAVTRHIDSSDWAMVVLQDADEILHVLNTNSLVMGSAILIGILIAFVAARRVASSVTAPIVRMAENAEKVADGRRDLTVETDLTEIVRLVDSFNAMVAEMDVLTEGLEHKIEERTQELTEKNAQLRRLMDDKEVFLAGVSHEIRSPMTAMIGFIDIVNMSGDDLSPDERAEMLETVATQAGDVLNLIEDLLASARAQAGTLKVADVRVDLAAQARQVIEATAQTSRHSVKFVGGEGYASGDPARVRQIVRNLITNASRYGGPEIEVGVAVDGNVASLHVRDNGDGIGDEDRDKIFEAYGQASDVRSVNDSVGLGLHVSRNLARLMGGDLDYEHTDGWSVFSLRLLKHVEDGEEGSTGTAPIVVSLGSTETQS